MNKPAFNYYRAVFEVVTARRAQIQGIPVSRPYGYFVLIARPYIPQPGHHGKRNGCERVESWCKTKAIAESCAQGYRDSQTKGYYGCQCGSDKQGRACCGVEKQKEIN